MEGDDFLIRAVYHIGTVGPVKMIIIIIYVLPMSSDHVCQARLEYVIKAPTNIIIICTHNFRLID